MSASLIISICALAISLYNTLSSQKIKSLEKRTILLSEISTAQQVIAEIISAQTEIDLLDFRESLTIKKGVKAKIKELQYIQSQLETFSSMVYKEANASAKKLELSMPLIKKIVQDLRGLMERQKKISKEINQIVEERPKLIT